MAAGTAAVSVAATHGALRRLRPEAEPGLAPRMGLTAAYVFAAQMVNFPVAAGTSGHLLGALLAAVLLGPHAATLVMAAVFVIQTFFFLDGGHTALGANLLNMGLAGTYGGYAVFRTLAGPAPGRRRALWAAAVAAWATVMLGAALTSAELVLSGTAEARRVFAAMLGVHAVIGLGEAAITAAALALLWNVRPDLLTGRVSAEPAVSRGGRLGWAAGAGLVAVALLAPFASPAPDGLEWVAGRLGFEERAASPLLGAPFPDYSLPAWTESGGLSGPVLVSLLGSALMLAALGLLFAAVRAARRRAAAAECLLPAGQPADGAAGRLDARVAVGCLFGTVLTAVLLPPQEAGKVGLLAGAGLAVVALRRIPAGWLAGRALLLLPFAALAALSFPQVREGSAGLSHFGLLLLRAAASLLATAAFLAGIPEPEVLAALRAYRAPGPVVETMRFALRYLRLLQAEAARMLQARASRSAGAGTLALRAQGAGGIVGSLFLRSFERAERVALAMEARGGLRPGPEAARRRPAVALDDEERRLRAPDLLFAAGFALFLLGIWLWR